MILITGGSGLLGKALHAALPTAHAPARADFPLEQLSYPAWLRDVGTAYLCAGTKGHAECEGNAEVFRADVDGNIRLGRRLLRQGTFVVFVSTDAVERTLNTAYARNRFFVELALGGHEHTAIVRPGRFDAVKAKQLADFCIHVGYNKLGGLHRWA